LEKHPQADSKQSSQNAIENQVEQSNLGCQKEMTQNLNN
jgi:hypothetical protein